MLGQILAIARNTFVESIRQPIFFVLIIAGGLLQIVNTLLSSYSMGFTEQTEVSGDDKLLLDMGLATVMVCVTLLSAFVATSVLSREIENKTALTVISKPVGRPVFIFGKYLGVTGAILVAAVILTVFFLFAIRHKVMSTARDGLDQPVVLFSSLSVLIPIAVAIWGNYFYGWVFPSTAILGMLPATVVALALTFTLSKEWDFQSPLTDFKPQVTLTALCAILAMLVLTSIAVAASTRLGQVMTLVVCTGAFMLGLLSNHLLGRHAFTNTPAGSITSVEPGPDRPITRAGGTIVLTLDGPPQASLTTGASLYIAPNPSGVGMVVPTHPPFTGDVMLSRDYLGPDEGGRGTPALVIRRVEADGKIVLLNVAGLALSRAPEAGDFIFTAPTQGNLLARAAWSVIPNLQLFWLVDAVTQGHAIPRGYLGLASAYAGAQIVGFLALAVLLFQRREVG